jgi:hypothetical protein
MYCYEYGKTGLMIDIVRILVTTDWFWIDGRINWTL